LAEAGRRDPGLVEGAMDDADLKRMAFDELCLSCQRSRLPNMQHVAIWRSASELRDVSLSKVLSNGHCVFRHRTEETGCGWEERN